MGQGVAVACALAVVGLCAAPAAQAQFRITDWRAQVYESADEIDENVFDQAGGHPFIGVTDFKRRARVRGGRLVVRGTVARRAGKRVRVQLRCGGTRVGRAAGRPRPGRWSVSLRLRGKCASADRARLRAAYPGGGAFKRAVRARRVRL